MPRRCLHGVHLFTLSILRSMLAFASALPARGASGSGHGYAVRIRLCLGAACTGCIWALGCWWPEPQSLPRRCLHGVHHALRAGRGLHAGLCLGAACTGCIGFSFSGNNWVTLCLGAACTGCILRDSPVSSKVLYFASALPARGASARPLRMRARTKTLPRRCLHGVHRQKPTNCGTPFCSIRRESVDSFSEINNKDSCADYFPALFCCQGDLHHHYRQPRTGNRPVLRCEQHRLFLFILSSHYRRLL